MRTNSARSTDRRPRIPAPAVDVYLFPAVVGGGLGDIEEVLACGRYLERAGVPLRLYRRSGRPLPPSVDGPFDWPAHTRRSKIPEASRAPVALTVSPCWGVSAAPSRPEPYGRGGVWEEECTDIERTYGPDRTLHVSLEEFARTLTSREETVERYREGGRAARAIRARGHTRSFAEEIDEFHRAFVRFRALDRPNLVHVFATFRRRSAFSREFPMAVQCGPLYSGRVAASQHLPRPRARGGWMWYASPSTSDRLLAPVLDGLVSRGRSTSLTIHTPRPMNVLRTEGQRGSLRVVVGPIACPRWRTEFERARMRIVTGSRTLLEAIELGGPFLYFNGLMGERAPHRHRPEKIRALLELGESGHADPRLLRDLADFSRGRRVSEIVRTANARQGAWERFPAFRAMKTGFRPPYDEAGTLVVGIVRALAARPDSLLELVRRVRLGQLENAPIRTSAG